MFFGLGVRGGAVLVWICIEAGAVGQTLAHKNWEGSGLAVQAWWSRGVFCSVGGVLKRVVGEMDALERMGCDAVEVSPGYGYGAAEEMDGLMEAAGRRKMRVVVDLAAAGDGVAVEQDLKGRMGFWGARGAAGFAVTGAGGGGLRQAAGGRLVIADEDGQLRVRRIPETDAAGLREWLSGTVGGRQRAGILLADGGAGLGYARAAMLLLSGTAARVSMDAVLPVAGRNEAPEFSAEELLLWVPKEKVASNGMVEWVRALSELHHGNANLRMGQAVFLDFDALGVLGWVVPGRDGRSGVLVMCNVGGKVVRVPVVGAVRGAGVRGTSLKMLLRSDGAVEDKDSLEGIGLGVDGVFVGEVR